MYVPGCRLKHVSLLPVIFPFSPQIYCIRCFIYTSICEEDILNEPCHYILVFFVPYADVQANLCVKHPAAPPLGTLTVLPVSVRARRDDAEMLCAATLKGIFNRNISQWKMRKVSRSFHDSLYYLTFKYHLYKRDTPSSISTW